MSYGTFDPNAPRPTPIQAIAPAAAAPHPIAIGTPNAPPPQLSPSNPLALANAMRSPGGQAALGYTGGGTQGGFSKAISAPGLGNFAPLTGSVGAPFNHMLGLGRKNNTPGQDIKQALYAGLPVSDASWKMFGYGPGGAALQQASPAAAPQAGMNPALMQRGMPPWLRGRF
jgi:hypothetical protein